MSLVIWHAGEKGFAFSKRVYFDQTEGCLCQLIPTSIFMLPHTALMARGEFQSVLLFPVHSFAWKFPGYLTATCFFQLWGDFLASTSDNDNTGTFTNGMMLKK